MYRSYLAFISAFLFLYLLPQEFLLPITAQENPCDPELQKRSDDPYGYSPRSGNRCEGTYVKNRSGTVLLVSLIESFEEYDFDSKKNLLVEWTPLGHGTMHLRAEGVRDQLYYRMDAVCESENKSYIWPLDVLAGLKHPKSDIGVIGWIQHSIGSVEKIYIPLRIKKENSNIASGFLFNMKLAFQNDLNGNNHVTESLRQEFEKNGIFLSRGTSINKGDGWWIMAGIDKGYMIKKEENKLAAYNARYYEVALLPGIELAKVYVSLAPVDSEGNEGKYIWKGRKLEYGSCPQGAPVKFLIFDLLHLVEPGIYYLEIGIVPKYDAPFSMKLWFYHSALPPSG